MLEVNKKNYNNNIIIVLLLTNLFKTITFYT